MPVDGCGIQLCPLQPALVSKAAPSVTSEDGWPCTVHQALVNDQATRPDFVLGTLTFQQEGLGPPHRLQLEINSPQGTLEYMCGS